MPWNGSGTYILSGAYSPEVNGTVIDATRYNGLTNDIAAGITAVLAKNGENAPSANLPMAGFKHTGAGAGTTAGQYLVYNQTGASLGGNVVMNAPSSGSTLTLNVLPSTAGVSMTDGVVTGQWGTITGTSTFFGTTSAHGFELRTNNINRLLIATGGNVTVTAPSSGSALTVIPATGTNGFLLSASLSGSSVQGNYTNSSNTANSHAVQVISVGGGSAGNPYLQFNVASVIDWTIGVDNSDSDSFKISSSGALGIENRLAITTDGRVYGSYLHNNTGSVTGTTNQYIASGTYTPTLTNSINITSSASGVAQWIRVGNVVTVTCGNININPAAAGLSTQLGISLPIASNFTSDVQCGGVGVGTQNVVYVSGRIYADIVGNKAFMDWFASTDDSGEPWSFSFTYLIV